MLLLDIIEFSLNQVTTHSCQNIHSCQNAGKCRKRLPFPSTQKVYQSPTPLNHNCVSVEKQKEFRSILVTPNPSQASTQAPHSPGTLIEGDSLIVLLSVRSEIYHNAHYVVCLNADHVVLLGAFEVRFGRIASAMNVLVGVHIFLIRIH